MKAIRRVVIRGEALMDTRRRFLHTAGVAIAAGATLFQQTMTASSAADTPPSGPGIDPSRLRVKLTFPDGKVQEFSGANGRDLGDFNVPFANIVQRNVLVTMPGSLFSIYLRPDRNSKRVEAVVLYGDPLHSDPATTGPYTFEIFADGKALDKVDVGYHFWLARWRWASHVRPQVRKPADIVKAGLSVEYATTPLTGRMPQSAPPYWVMEFSSITPFMGQTGERGDIGQNPEITSAYMATGDDTAYTSMMAWAEASATGPWHINDPHTKAILNWNDWPTATTYSTQTSTPPFFVMKNEKNYMGKFLRPEDAHHPCLSYIPFLSTGDPYHAEELQYQINFYLGGEHNQDGSKSYIFDRLQTRGYAWMLRSVVFCYLAADEIKARTLLPKSFWKNVLDRNLSWIMTGFVRASDAKTQRFFSGTSRTTMGWWQEDYLCGVLAMMQRIGRFSEWRPVLDWKIQSDINRVNGTSGWPRTHPTIYYAQWFAQHISARPGNRGNGGVVESGAYGPRATPILGDYTVAFVDDKTFRVTRPDGRHDAPGKGTVGKPYSSGYGPRFTADAGSVPFAPGDSFTVSIVPPKNWAELAQINNITDSSDGSLQVQSGDYMAHLFAVLTLAAPLMPETRPLLAWLTEAMSRAGCRVPYRDSYKGV
jgi:hypothetical protein